MTTPAYFYYYFFRSIRMHHAGYALTLSWLPLIASREMINNALQDHTTEIYSVLVAKYDSTK